MRNNDSFFLPQQSLELKKIEEKAEQKFIPIISPEVGQFLKVLIQISSPKKILEVGTAVGYSTIWMAQAAGSSTEIVTIEKDESRAEEALNNFCRVGIDNQVKLKIGDALEIIPRLRRKFDFVFIDAAKGQYLYFLDYILDLLPSGGLIVADNVLYRGFVEKKGPVKHKRRTMVNRLRQYLETVSSHHLLETSIISMGDGLAVSIKKEEKISE